MAEIYDLDTERKKRGDRNYSEVPPSYFTRGTAERHLKRKVKEEAEEGEATFLRTEKSSLIRKKWFITAGILGTITTILSVLYIIGSAEKKAEVHQRKEIEIQYVPEVQQKQEPTLYLRYVPPRKGVEGIVLENSDYRATYLDTNGDATVDTITLRRLRTNADYSLERMVFPSSPFEYGTEILNQEQKRDDQRRK